MSDADDVRAIEEHWPTAMQQRDGQWLRDHTTEGLIVTQPDGSTLDRERYLAHREAGNDTIVHGVSVAERIEVMGDAAVVTNRAQIIAETSSGDRYELLIRGTALYLRADRWRVAAMHISEHSDNRDNWGADLIDEAP